MTIAVAVLIVFSLVLTTIGTYVYIKKKKKDNSIKKSIDPVACSTMLDFSNMMADTKSDCNGTNIERKNSQNSYSNVDQESVLPTWLNRKKELIFSISCIEKNEQLGSGKYGTVYKGKLKQGNAVYVIKILTYTNICCNYALSSI